MPNDACPRDDFTSVKGIYLRYVCGARANSPRIGPSSSGLNVWVFMGAWVTLISVFGEISARSSNCDHDVPASDETSKVPESFVSSFNYRRKKEVKAREKEKEKEGAHAHTRT